MSIKVWMYTISSIPFFALLYILPYKNAFPSDTNNQYGTEGGRI